MSGAPDEPHDDAPPATRRVVLTRPAGQSALLVEALHAAGWQVHDWPALLLTGLPALDVPHPGAFDLVMCVSGNAVRFYFEQLATARGTESVVWPVGVPIAVVGPSSAQAVRDAGGARIDVIQPADDVATFDSEALWARLSALPELPRNVLIVRGGAGPTGEGRSWLAERLTQAGAHVTLYSAYRRAPAIWPAQRLRQLRAWRAGGHRPVWHISSREALSAIVDQIGPEDAVAGWLGARVVVGHPRIADALERVVLSCGAATRRTEGPGAAAEPSRVVIQTSMPTDAAVLATIVN